MSKVLSPLGTINGFSVCRAKTSKGTPFVFNGTVKGLTNTALSLGVKIGDRVKADFGGYWSDYTLTSAPHDDRCNGHWMVETKHIKA